MTRRYSGGPDTRSSGRIQVDVVVQFTTRDAAVPPYQFTPRAHQLHPRSSISRWGSDWLSSMSWAKPTCRP
jgi:hypothetical protein